MGDRLKAAFVRAAGPLLAIAPATVAMRGMFSNAYVYCYRDLALIHWPVHRWLRNTIAAGDAPLWDPYLALGQSAIAEPWRLILFPPVAALRLLPAETLAFNLVVGLPFPVAALGMYVLLHTKLTRASAVLGAVVFSVSSTVLSTGNMPLISWSAALAPWMIWGVAEAARSRSGRWLALGAALVGLTALVGEPVLLTVTALIALPYAVIVASSDRRGAVRALAWAMAALAVGGLLAAVEYLPLVEAVRRSPRAASEAYYLGWSLHPLRLLETLVPFPFNNAIATPPEYDAWGGVLSEGREPLLVSEYVGIPAIALASLGAIAGERRRAVFWGVVVVVCLVWAFGSYTPAYPALLQVAPPFRLFRYPEKYALFAVLGLAALAAEGWDALARGDVRRLQSWLPIAVVAVLLLAVGVATATASRLAAAVGAGTGAAEHTRVLVAHGAPSLVAVCVATVAAIAWLTSRTDRRRRVGALAILVIALDLLGAGAWLNPQADAVVFGEPEWVAKAAATNARVFSGIYLAHAYIRQDSTSVQQTVPDAESVLPSISAPPEMPYYAINAMMFSTFGVYESQWKLRGVLALDIPRMLPNEYRQFNRVFRSSSPERRARALERVGVRTQVRLSRPPGDYGEPEEIARASGASAYFSPEPFERIMLVASARVEPDSTKAIDALFDEAFDPRAEALVERETAPAGVAGVAAGPNVDVAEDRPNSIEVGVTAPAESTLVVLDSYNPGWRAEVDGVRAEIVRVDGLFYGVRLAPGRHDVKLVFRPASLVVGAWISALTALALAALAVASARRARATRAREGA
jgi:hypothetical protein